MRGKFPLLPRKNATDKFAYGHALVLAGSRAFPGAAILCAWAASRSGAGLVTLATAASLRPTVLKRFSPEIMPVFLHETWKGSVRSDAFMQIRKLIAARGVNAMAIGPGLTHQTSTSALVRKLVTKLTVPIVLDADGLNAFRGRLRELGRHDGPLILTPHAGEFERLFGEAWPESHEKREALAKMFSRRYDAVLVLKSHKTLTVYRDKIVWNVTGNPGMAKGGSGDALVGVIAAFLAQGLRPFEAAAWGVYFHGKAGDLAVRQKGQLSLTAGDLIEYLPTAFKARR